MKSYQLFFSGDCKAHYKQLAWFDLIFKFCVCKNWAEVMVGGAHTYSLDDGGRETKKGGDGKMEIALCLTFQWVFHFRVISVTMETFLFFFFWLHCVLVAARGLSLVAVSRGYSSLRCVAFLLLWLLLLWSTGSQCMGFSSCGTRAQQLWLTGSRADRKSVV